MKQIIHIFISISLVFSPAFAQSRGQTENKGNLSQTQKDKFAKANPEDITDENFPETIESFDFPNVDINDVIKAISELTGKNFIIDPGVRGKITIIAPSKITVAEAYRAFLSALAINGFTIVPSGNFLKVKLARNAQRDSIETYSGTYYPNTDQLITRIINLKHIQADQVTRELTMLTSNNGEMRAYPPTNSIIISDFV
jgi:general secretion pathway protein D